HSESNLAALAPRHIDEIRERPHYLIGFSESMSEKHQSLKRFLREYLYRHYRVHRAASKSQRMVRDLFEVFLRDTRLLPTEHQLKARQMESEHGTAGKARAVADYIAGMTDRYAFLEHRKVCQATEIS
ncbi:MAG TPA: deoxyguanosinetriphosphate triphosphohydrolase, partial [Gammaproteobacteria bacterium]